MIIIQDDFEEDLSALDDFIEMMKKMPPDKRTFISEPIRLAQLKSCAAMLEDMTRDTKGSEHIEFRSGSFDRSIGGVSIVVTSLDVDDIDKFSKMVELTDALEIELLLDGRIRISFTFRNLYTSAN